MRHQEADGICWHSAALTDQGKKRKHNEDALLARPDLRFWLVADGMGGHAAGDVASKIIVEALEAVQPADELASFVDSAIGLLESANRTIRDYAVARQGGSTMGATVVSFLAGKQHGACIWAGDSRLYRLRDGALEQLTRDHSEVQRLVDEGLLTADEAENHPNANVITRAVGGAPELLLDTRVFDLAVGDRYLLCSDGLYNELLPEKISELLQLPDVSEVVRSLIEATLDHGARDNVSVVVVEAGAL